MKEIIRIDEDTREIESVWNVNDSEGNYFRVGVGQVTKIEIYREDGQMSGVPWAAIYQGDSIKWRCDMAGMGITYKEASK